MATYLIIIFFFGLVITGIVFLGIQEAAELSKRLAVQTLEASRVANSSATSSERGSAPSADGRIVWTIKEPVWLSGRRVCPRHDRHDLLRVGKVTICAWFWFKPRFPKDYGIRRGGYKVKNWACFDKTDREQESIG